MTEIVFNLIRLENGCDLAMENHVQMSSGNEKLDDDKVDDHGSEAPEGEQVGPPTEGMAFTSEEEVRDYYAKYAQRTGFGIYRRSSRCGDDGKVKYFTLACANAGKVRPTNASNSVPKRQSAKTNCKAKINVAVESDVRVYVCHVVLEHNHELNPGMVQRNIRKKVWSPRVPRKRENREKVGTRSGIPSLLPNAGRFPGCENLSSGENRNYDCAS